jgi:hypothetical protein
MPVAQFPAGHSLFEQIFDIGLGRVLDLLQARFAGRRFGAQLGQASLMALEGPLRGAGLPRRGRLSLLCGDSRLLGFLGRPVYLSQSLPLFVGGLASATEAIPVLLQFEPSRLAGLPALSQALGASGGLDSERLEAQAGLGRLQRRSAGNAGIALAEQLSALRLRLGQRSFSLHDLCPGGFSFLLQRLLGFEPPRRL